MAYIVKGISFPVPIPTNIRWIYDHRFMIYGFRMLCSTLLDYYLERGFPLVYLFFSLQRDD